MSPSRSARLRRLLAELSSGGTRPKAVARVRRKAGARVAGGAVDRRPAPKVVAPPPLPLTAGRRPTWYVGAWGRLASAVAGKDPALDPGTPHPDDGAALVRSARRHRGQAAFAEALGAGLPLSVATCRAVSMLAAVREHSAAWALAESVHGMPGGADAGTAGHAVLLHSRGQLLRAWERVHPLDDAILLEALPLQAVDAALAAGTEESRARAVRLVADPTVFGAADLVDLAGRFLVMGHRPEALALVAELTGRSEVTLDERRAHVADRLEEWLSDREVLVPDGAVPIGIIDYSSPDHVLTSGNLGDYVQTLALLGNLARLGDLTFTGECGLGDVATELQGHVGARFRVPGVGGAVHLVPVDRDVSSLGSVPADTWAVAFGWHMHPLFGLKYDFPYNPHLRPIFVSFHVNRLDMLDDEALAYLREHGPVGCRDWTTVNLLLSAGVDAFFTGCFTSTVDTLFPERSEVFSGSPAVGFIDRKAEPAKGGAAADPVREYTHQSDGFRFMAPAEGIRAAHARLGEYQRDLDRVVTSRLHAYLPLTSLGVRSTSDRAARATSASPASPGSRRVTRTWMPCATVSATCSPPSSRRSWREPAPTRCRPGGGTSPPAGWTRPGRVSPRVSRRVSRASTSRRPWRRPSLGRGVTARTTRWAVTGPSTWCWPSTPTSRGPPRSTSSRCSTT